MVEVSYDEEQIIYVAVCRTHDFEGMRRGEFGEAALDLSGHFELFPDEEHEGGKVSVETLESFGAEKGENGLNVPKPGSTHGKSAKGATPRWHKKDRFDLGPHGGRVEVKSFGTSADVLYEKVICTREDQKQFIFSDLGGMFPEKQVLPAGRYIISFDYKWSVFSGRPVIATFGAFVHWKPFKKEQEW